MPDSEFVLFSGTSHQNFAQEIAAKLGKELGRALIHRFPDGEIGVQILENVRGRDTFVIQTIAKKPNLYLMELLILIDALKRASARRIIAVLPYYGYGRQDRKDKGRVPITAKLVANLLETAGATRVVTMDLHTEQIQGFFDIPVDNLLGRPALLDAIASVEMENPIVTAPDIGSVKLARAFASELECDFAAFDKRRTSLSDVSVNAIMGDVEGKDVILVDDICSTGSTLKKASLACKEAGARHIYGVVTHPLMTEDVLLDSGIEKLFVTNTISLPEELDQSQIEVVSVAGLFASAIDCVVNNHSISEMFRPKTERFLTLS